jgi:hypothetical protein
MTPAARCRLAIAMTALAAYACGSSDRPAEQATSPTTQPPLITAEPADPTHVDWEGVQRIADAQAAQARAARHALRPRPEASTPPGAVTAPARTSAPVGDGLPPMKVILCESGDNYRAENPTSTASGRYQITDGSWNGYGGYHHAADAPPDVQDARARQMWAGGAGAHHWKACL